MSDTAFGVIKPDCAYASMSFTRVCSVCCCKESVSNYTKDEFWLCPDCLKKLKKLLGGQNV